MSPRALIIAAIVLTLASPAIAQTAPTPAYPGIEKDAEWRKEAHRRIDEIRKANLTIVVLDEKGQPVKDAGVTAKQHRQAFHFAVRVNPALLQSAGDGEFSEEDREKYRSTIVELFDTVRVPDEAGEEDKQAVQTWARLHSLLSDTAENAIDVPCTYSPEDLVPPVELVEKLSELAPAEEKLRVPNYSFAADPADPAQLALQASYTRDVFTVLFSNPHVTEICLAGFWASAGTLEGWALFDKDWNPLPVGDTYKTLVRKEWWTDDNGLTNAAGECVIRGFLGEYRITITVAGRTKTINASLVAGGTRTEIKLEPPPAPAASAPKE